MSGALGLGYPPREAGMQGEMESGDRPLMETLLDTESAFLMPSLSVALASGSLGPNPDRTPRTRA